jgi:hypothetical protein
VVGHGEVLLANNTTCISIRREIVVQCRPRSYIPTVLTAGPLITVIVLVVSMGTEFKDVDVNMEDSGNSCGSSVVSDYSGPSDHTDFDGDGVQVSDLEGDSDELRLPQVRTIGLAIALFLFFAFLRRKKLLVFVQTEFW